VIPIILDSSAYRDNGAMFIPWDEGSGSGLNGPVSIIVIPPLTKACGYASTNRYVYALTLRPMRAIFGVQPFLGEASTAKDLADLFRSSARRPTVLDSAGRSPGRRPIPF
jgi:hypothetical protein